MREALSKGEMNLSQAESGKKSSPLLECGRIRAARIAPASQNVRQCFKKMSKDIRGPPCHKNVVESLRSLLISALKAI